MPKKTPLKLMSAACAQARGSAAGQRPDRLDDAGVVDQRVDAAEGLVGAGDRGLHLAVLGDVAGHRLGLGAAPAQPRGELGDALGRAGEEQHRRALGGQRLGGGRADAAARPGDDHGLAGELTHARSSPARRLVFRDERRSGGERQGRSGGMVVSAGQSA